MIAAIHGEYLEAGADIIETNTFNARRSRRPTTASRPLAYELNVEGARLARRAADEWTAKTPERPRFVAGAIGPTNKHAVDLARRQRPGVPRGRRFDEMRAAYAEQARGLIDGGVDVAAASRRSSTRSTPRRRSSRSRRSSTSAASELPLMISVTITDRSGRTLSGQTLDAFYISIAHARPFSVGLNCALGAREMRPYLAELARIADVLRQLLPERRAAQRLRRVRRAAGRDRARCSGSSPTAASSTSSAAAAARRRITSARSRRRSRASRRVRARRPTPDADFHGCHAIPGLEPLDDPARQQLPDDRRAHQRHRLEALRPADQGRRLHRRRRRRARPGARRRQHPRRQHGRGHARLRSGDDDVPQLHRDRARNRAPADHDRQLEVVGASRPA